MGKLKSPQRQIAYKVWISDLINSNFVKQEGWNPNYVTIDDTKVSRVNIMATVVGKFVSEDGNYGTLTLDDGTETIRVKAFGPDVPKISETNMGKIVRFVGKVKEYEEEIYVSPEIIRELEDPNWILVRRAELKEPEEQEESKEKETIPEEKAEEEIKAKDKEINAEIVNYIKELDEGKGADMDKVIEKTGLDKEEAKNFLFGLLKRGDIFEPKKGKLKVLE